MVDGKLHKRTGRQLQALRRMEEEAFKSAHADVPLTPTRATRAESPQSPLGPHGAPRPRPVKRHPAHPSGQPRPRPRLPPPPQKAQQGTRTAPEGMEEDDPVLMAQYLAQGESSHSPRGEQPPHAHDNL